LTLPSPRLDRMLNRCLRLPVFQVNHFPKEKTGKKESPLRKVGGKGCQGFREKVFTTKNQIKEKTFLPEPGGLGLYCPGRRLTFAFLFCGFMCSDQNACLQRQNDRVVTQRAGVGAIWL